MGDTLWVDKPKLRVGAGLIDRAADDLEAGAGGEAIPALAAAAEALAGSVTVGELTAIARALTEATSDMVNAMRGVAQGLEQAANRFHTVDVVAARAAAPIGR